ncbi:MAG: glycosyltransferase family 4 protein [Proteobacteria bacterium]|nr:glycosyltransferase family 4 protein [Pseudomonadota bacterium]
MKILVISQYFWPENFRINELVAELVKRGHQMTVLTGRPNYPDGTLLPEYRNRPNDYKDYLGAKIVRVPILLRGRGRLRLLLNYASFAFSGCIWGGWRLRREPFDVIFTFGPSPITVGIPSAWMRWLKGVSQVFWVLDLWPETLRAVGVVRQQWILQSVERLVRLVYRHCDLILAQSKSFVEDIARYTPVDRRVEYFPAWAEAVFSDGKVTPASQVPAAHGVFTVLFAGNIGEAQDFPAILDAAECLRERENIRWIIVGEGRMAGWVREQVAARGLNARVIMVGRQPLEQMPGFFAHADALLVSLKDESVFAMTIPGKIQSYLAADQPVLAMLNGEGASIVRKAQAGLVCAAGDGAGLAKIVEQMAALTSQARRNMGERGRSLCAEEFDRNMLISRLENWLEEIVRERGDARAVNERPAD